MAKDSYPAAGVRIDWPEKTITVDGRDQQWSREVYDTVVDAFREMAEQPGWKFVTYPPKDV